MRNQTIRVFDNGGQTVDRYTLITRDDEIYGFNETPYHPQGFGQYCGTWQGGMTKHLGKRVTIADLPEDAQQFVIERINAK